MSALIDSCGLREKHDPHWVVAAPEGGVGGVYCEGNGTGETEFERDFVTFLKGRTDGAF